MAHGGDIATTEGAASLVDTALETYGRLDTLVNNAGFLRDRMLVNLDEDDWDAVVRVHLKGHFLPLQARGRALAGGGEGRADAGRRPGRQHHAPGPGCWAVVGQGNYSAAKAGIVGLTLVAAAEMGRYGVQVNAIAPAARTRMTERDLRRTMAAPAGGFDAMAPENVSPLVVWLGSAASAGRHRAGLRGRGRPDHRHGGLAAGADRRQGHAVDTGGGGGRHAETPGGGGGSGGGVRGGVAEAVSSRVQPYSPLFTRL